MFATYLTLAQEACVVVKAHKEGLVDQIAGILSDGVKQGVFDIADVKATGARALRCHQPLLIIPPTPRNGKIPSSRRGSTRCWRCC